MICGSSLSRLVPPRLHETCSYGDTIGTHLNVLHPGRWVPLEFSTWPNSSLMPLKQMVCDLLGGPGPRCHLCTLSTYNGDWQLICSVNLINRQCSSCEVLAPEAFVPNAHSTRGLKEQVWSRERSLYFLTLTGRS